MPAESHNMELLLVEDDKNLSSVMREFLLKQGFTIVCAYDVDGAFEKIHQNKPDLILLDINLPDIDGFTFLDYIREEGLDMPVIVVTGNVQRNNQVQTYEKGANLFHPKPIDFTLLVSQINNLINNSRKDSEIVVKSEDLGLSLNIMLRELSHAGRTVTLTPGETKVIETVLRNQGNFIHSQSFLLHNGNPMPRKTRDSIISKLRKKLHSLAPGLELANIKGTGFRLCKRE